MPGRDDSTDAAAGGLCTGALPLFEQRTAARMHRHTSNPSPSRRAIVPNLASQSACAFSSIAWNTGSSSPGERLMTRSTSDGSGLLLQRFAQLVEQPGVLDGDDGLVGEGLQHRELLVRKQPGACRATLSAPIATSPRIIGMIVTPDSRSPRSCGRRPPIRPVHSRRWECPRSGHRELRCCACIRG